MTKSYVAAQTYYFRSDYKTVFRGLTDPELLVKWFLSEAEISPRKGGEFRFAWMGGYRMTGKILQYARNKSVAFLWTDKLPGGRVVRSRAAFLVARKGSGTVLKLRHSGFKVPQHFAECSSRWAYYLTNMKSVLDHATDLRSDLDW
jgi:uncharacterized protein YndB with AHSA1/START domain